MASEMEWSHDFCLSCDRQIAEGAYCSQACRLADLEKAGTSDPATSLHLSSSASSYASSSAGFYLPPAVNFAAYKASTAPRPAMNYSPPSSPQYATANGSYFYHSAANQQKRSLTPSSSRTSLSSTSSQTTTAGLTAQAANDLNGYVRSFDRTRYERRPNH